MFDGIPLNTKERRNITEYEHAAIDAVRRIKKGSDLISAEEDLAESRSQMDAASREISELLAKRTATNAPDTERKIILLDQERKRLSPIIRKRLEAVTSLQGPYHQRVDAALAKIRREAGKRALQALGDLREVVAEMYECNRASSSVGAPPVLLYPIGKDLAALERSIVRRWIVED